MQTATVKSAALAGWRDALLAHGLDPLDSGNHMPDDIQEDAWSCGNHDIPLRSFVSLSERAGHLVRRPGLGWQIGEQYDLRGLDDIGVAIGSASHLGTALRRFADYFSLLQDATEVRLDVADQVAQISYRILDPDIWPRHQDAMFSLGIVAQIVRKSIGVEWDKVDVTVEAGARESSAELAKTVGAPVWCDGETNAIRMPAAFLDLPMAKEDRQIDLRQLSGALASKRRSQAASTRVRGLVYQDLTQRMINQERLAREIGMSSRTMRRKLAEEGWSFQEILDDCRMRQAVFEFQTRPDQSIAQIALRLGYAEHSTFTRAFVRWAGKSPQAYRRDMVQGSLH